MRDTGCGIRDAGYEMRDTRCGIRDAGYEMRDTRCGIRDAGYEMRDMRCAWRATGGKGGTGEMGESTTVRGLKFDVSGIAYLVSRISHVSRVTLHEWII
jgi:hypothetical protein